MPEHVICFSRQFVRGKRLDRIEAVLRAEPAPKPVRSISVTEKPSLMRSLLSAWSALSGC